MKSQRSIKRGKHRAESRDGGGELQQTTAPASEARSQIQEMFHIVESLYLDTLEGEEKARAEELVKNNPEAKAYLDQLENEVITDENFESLDAELGRRLPWLLTPPPVEASAMAKAMASLYGPPVANFDPSETLKQQKKAALGSTVPVAASPRRGMAASLEQIQLPPRPSGSGQGT